MKNFQGSWSEFWRYANWTINDCTGVPNIGGKEKDFIAEITEQLPDKRIAWRSRSGASHVGVVTFHALNDWQTRIMIQMEYEPEGIIENAGDALGFTTRRIENDLERFKEFIEARGSETGAWRGRIERGA